jgi:hypothetical protein
MPDNSHLHRPNLLAFEILRLAPSVQLWIRLATTNRAYILPDQQPGKQRGLPGRSGCAGAMASPHGRRTTKARRRSLPPILPRGKAAPTCRHPRRSQQGSELTGRHNQIDVAQRLVGTCRRCRPGLAHVTTCGGGRSFGSARPRAQHASHRAAEQTNRYRSPEDAWRHGRLLRHGDARVLQRGLVERPAAEPSDAAKMHCRRLTEQARRLNRRHAALGL